MFPIFKFASLLVRLFSRPAVELMKWAHNNRVHPESRFSEMLRRLGNFQYRFKVRLDKKILNIRTDPEIFLKPLKDEVALEKGIHFFYETLFYTLVIGAASYEGWRISKEAKEDRERKQRKIEEMSARLDSLIESADELIQEDQQTQRSFVVSLSDSAHLLETILTRTDEIVSHERRLHAFLEEATQAQATLSKDLEDVERKVKPN